MTEYLALTGIVLGAAGFWHVLSMLLFWRNEKRIKAATANNLMAQTDKQVISNWIAWSEKLEARLKELEEEVSKLREENFALHQQLSELQSKKDG